MGQVGVAFLLVAVVHVQGFGAELGLLDAVALLAGFALVALGMKRRVRR